MSTLREQILKTIAHNAPSGTRMVPEGIIIANCRAAGYDEATAHRTLATLVAEGRLVQAGGAYARQSDPEGPESLRVSTYRGTDGTPWQFSLTRTPRELVLSQARGPPERFDPVVTRFPIEEQPVGTEPVEFRHTVSRRVWSEDPARPEVRSQRSEGHIIEFLYRDTEGRHLVRPTPPELDDPIDTAGGYRDTAHPGVAVAATFLRTEDDGESKFTAERDYRVTREILTAYTDVYVLSYDELNEESVERAVWDRPEATAYRLVAAND